MEECGAMGLDGCFEDDEFTWIFPEAVSTGSLAMALEWCEEAARSGWLDDSAPVLQGYGSLGEALWVEPTPMGLAVLCGLHELCERLSSLGATFDLGDQAAMEACRTGSGAFADSKAVSNCFAALGAARERRELEKSPEARRAGMARGV